MDGDTPILTALRRIAACNDTGSDRRRVERDWRTVYAHLAHAYPCRKAGDRADELLQNAALKVLRSVRGMTADTEAGARAWLARVLNNAYHDQLRALIRERHRRSEREVESLQSGADRLQEERLDHEQLGHRLLHFVETELDAMKGGPIQRRKAELQARAALLRVREGEDTETIRGSLGEPDISDDLVNKWVERGRPIVLRGLDRWLKQAGELEKDDVRALHKLFSLRRRDAGKPRPGRRGKRTGAAKSGKSRRPVSSPAFWPSVQYRKPYEPGRGLGRNPGNRRRVA
jgi:DNA-directed RNA polymerase specialized sigma24 family protein